MSKSIIKNSIYCVIKTITTLIFPVISFSYASRILMPEGIGKVDFSKSFVVYFTLLAMLGIHNYGMRECARVRDDRNALSKTAREILRVNTVSVIVSYLLFFVIVFSLETLAPYRELLLINCFTIGLTAIGIEWLYGAVEDYKYIAVRTCFVQIISFICMLVFIKTSDDIGKYAAIQVISNGGAFIFNFIHSRKYIDWKSKIDFDCNKHIKPILVLFLMSAIMQILTVMDSTMLGFLANDKAVGLYGASNKISNIVVSATCSIIMVLSPRMAYYAEKNMMDDIKKISIKAINCMLMLSIPATIGLIMLSTPSILLFSGDSFSDADITTKLISLRNLLAPLNTFIVLHFFVPLKKEKYNLFSTGSAAIINLTVNFILIPLFAQDGAAVATVAAEFIELVINLFFFSKYIELKQIFNKTWQYIVSAIPIAPICYLLSLCNMNIALYSLLSIALSVIFYFGILLLFKNSLILDGYTLIKTKFFNRIKKH